jgi:hypothetical protein
MNEKEHQQRRNDIIRKIIKTTNDLRKKYTDTHVKHMHERKIYDFKPYDCPVPDAKRRFKLYDFSTSNILLWRSIAKAEYHHHRNGLSLSESIFKCKGCDVCDGDCFSYFHKKFFYSHFRKNESECICQRRIISMDIEKVKRIITHHCDIFHVELNKPICDYTNMEMINVFNNIYSNCINMIENGIEVDPEQHPDFLKDVYEQYGNVNVTEMRLNVDV